jgi:hypothetical protein
VNGNALSLLIMWGLISLLAGLFRKKAAPPGPGRNAGERQAGGQRAGVPVPEPWQRLGERLERELRSREPREVMRKYREWDRERAGPPPAPTPPAVQARPGPDVLQPTISTPTAERPREVEYLGSLGYASAEGVGLEGPITEPAPVQGDKDMPLAPTGGLPRSLAIAQALTVLRSQVRPATGAATAIVLSEILGRPRALRPRPYVTPSGRHRQARE